MLYLLLLFAGHVLGCCRLHGLELSLPYVVCLPTHEFVASKFTECVPPPSLRQALAVLKKELVPTGADKAEYRHRLTTGFFFKFFIAAVE